MSIVTTCIGTQTIGIGRVKGDAGLLTNRRSFPSPCAAFVYQPHLDWLIDPTLTDPKEARRNDRRLGDRGPVAGQSRDLQRTRVAWHECSGHRAMPCVQNTALVSSCAARHPWHCFAARPAMTKPWRQYREKRESGRRVTLAVHLLTRRCWSRPRQHRVHSVMPAIGRTIGMPDCGVPELSWSACWGAICAYWAAKSALHGRKLLTIVASRLRGGELCAAARCSPAPRLDRSDHDLRLFALFRSPTARCAVRRPRDPADLASKTRARSVCALSGLSRLFLWGRSSAGGRALFVLPFLACRTLFAFYVLGTRLFAIARCWDDRSDAAWARRGDELPVGGDPPPAPRLRATLAAPLAPAQMERPRIRPWIIAGVIHALPGAALHCWILVSTAGA